MSFTFNQNMVPADLVQQFHDSLEIASQQKDSRLQAAVHDLGMITGESFTIKDMGWDAPEACTRYAMMNEYGLSLPVEKHDLQKLIAEPQGLLQLVLSAMSRKKDHVIYRALLDPVPRTVEHNVVYVAFPAAQKILAGGLGMTKEKLIAAKAMFRRNECDEQDGEELYIAYNADMLTQISSDTTLTRYDFMAVQMMQEGELARNWLGFRWIPYENLDSVTDTKTTVAWAKTAVHFGTGAEYNTDIGRRLDKNNTFQVSVSASYGAGRANEKKVVAIEFLS